jgi:hypothetical protein
VERPALTIQALRIICFALIGGLVMITVGAVFLRTQGMMTPVPAAEQALPLAVALAFATSVGLHFVLRPKLINEAAKAKTQSMQMLSEQKVPQALGAATIVGAAIFEGPGLLGAVTFLLGGPWYCVAAPVLAIAAIAWMVPSRERFEEELRTAGA